MANTLSGTLTADGQSATWGFNETASHSNNTQTIVFANDFGGGTAKVQISPDNETSWVDIPNTTATDDTTFNIEAREGARYRIDLSSATSPDFDYWVLR